MYVSEKKKRQTSTGYEKRYHKFVTNNDVQLIIAPLIVMRGNRQDLEIINALKLLHRIQQTQ